MTITITSPIPPTLLSLPAEIRNQIYIYCFLTTTIHVSSATTRRSSGTSLLPTTTSRTLPPLIYASRQLHTETLPILAENSTLIFSDYYNTIYHLSLISTLFSTHIQRIALKGDLIPGNLLTQFPKLQHITYTQLGNTFLPPLPTNNYNKQVMKASQAEIVDLVLGKSPALRQLIDMCVDDTPIPTSTQPERKKIRLVAEANVLSCHERVTVWIDVNAREIICRRLMGVHRLYENVGPSKTEVRD